MVCILFKEESAETANMVDENETIGVQNGKVACFKTVLFLFTPISSLQESTGIEINIYTKIEAAAYMPIKMIIYK